MYCLNIWGSLIFYLISCLIRPFDELLVSAACALVTAIPFIIHTKLNRKINKWLLLAYIIAAQIFPFVFRFDVADIANRLLYLGIAVCFGFVSLYVLRALFVRGLKYKLGVDEQICFAVIVICLSAAVAEFKLQQVAVVDIFACLAVLLTLSTMSDLAAFCSAATIGAGYALSSGNLAPVAVYCVWAFAAVAFCSLSRYASVGAVALVQLVVVFFFGSGNWQELIGAGIGCIIYAVIPTKTLNGLRDCLGNCKEQYSPSGIINKIRYNMARRLYELSDVFYSMQISYKGLVRKTLPPDQAATAICREVSDSVCNDCPEKTRCWRINVQNTEETFYEIITAGLDRGKATLLDVSSSLTSSCLRLSALLSAVNREVSAYKEYFRQATAASNGKMLISEQFGGVSRIMLELSNGCKHKLIFDHEKEKTAVQELTFYNCLTKEAVIWQEEQKLFATLTIHKADAEKEIIQSIISKICKVDLTLDSVETVGADQNWRVLFYRPKQTFNVAFGIAQATKQNSGASGDTHSFIKLNNDKFLIALCDGMGSGTEAEKQSSSTISLVENFYKAGFDSEVILSGVNKLLIDGDRESFTALDICVVDLQKGLTDFIKLSAPDSVVKCENTVQFITGGSLPLGVLEEMRPVITKKVMRCGDLIVMFTDGYADCFESLNTVADAVQNVVFTNPQIIAEELMSLAIKNCKGIFADDATLIVARIIPA